LLLKPEACLDHLSLSLSVVVCLSIHWKRAAKGEKET